MLAWVLVPRLLGTRLSICMHASPTLPYPCNFTMSFSRRLVKKNKLGLLLGGTLGVTTLVLLFLDHLKPPLPDEMRSASNMNREVEKKKPEGEVPKSVNIIDEPEAFEYEQQGHKDDATTGQTSPRATTNSTGCLKWAGVAPKPPYFITAVLLMRIYEKDKAKLTTRELKMWLEYLRYAGVEHVYVYDAWVYERESPLAELDSFLSDGYVTYIDWHTHNPYTIAGTQVAAYQDCIDKYSHENQWQVAIDIDEYPFSPVDTEPGFLFRYIKNYSEYHRDTSELTMQNFLFLGKPQNKELMIERLLRRTHSPANVLVKPIYKPSNVRAQVHHNILKIGKSRVAPTGELRMNHYWGARMQNWGEDTPEILAKTEVDNGMMPIINAFKECEQHIRHYL